MKRVSALVSVFALSLACSHPAVSSGLNQYIASLSFDVDIPPALIVVQDGAGHQSGVDVSKPVTPYGFGAILDGIPGSETERENIAQDDQDKQGQPSAHTLWSIRVGTTGRQTFTVSLTGIASSYCELTLQAATATRLAGGEVISTLVAPGVVRVLRVTFDPASMTITTRRIVNGSDLLADIETACHLQIFGTGNTYIEPSGVCQSLKAKAGAVENALKRGSRNGASGALNAFLSELKALGVKHIKEPALTILREEAEALLKTLPTAQKPKGSSKK